MAPTRSTGEAVWHDIECGAYTADLPLWQELADDVSQRTGSACRLTRTREWHRPRESRVGRQWLRGHCARQRWRAARRAARAGARAGNRRHGRGRGCALLRTRRSVRPGARAHAARAAASTARAARHARLHQPPSGARRSGCDSPCSIPRRTGRRQATPHLHRTCSNRTVGSTRASPSRCDARTAEGRSSSTASGVRSRRPERSRSRSRALGWSSSPPPGSNVTRAMRDLFRRNAARSRRPMTTSARPSCR